VADSFVQPVGEGVSEMRIDYGRAIGYMACTRARARTSPSPSIHRAKASVLRTSSTDHCSLTATQCQGSIVEDVCKSVGEFCRQRLRNCQSLKNPSVRDFSRKTQMPFKRQSVSRLLHPLPTRQHPFVDLSAIHLTLTARGQATFPFWESCLSRFPLKGEDPTPPIP
jgi:hypothetical protein